MQLETVDCIGISSKKQDVKGAQGQAGRSICLPTSGFFAGLNRERLFEDPERLTWKNVNLHLFKKF